MLNLRATRAQALSLNELQHLLANGSLAKPCEHPQKLEYNNDAQTGMDPWKPARDGSSS